MLLTVSKRLEFSASRRLHDKDWSDAENLRAFGPETNARYGSGRNYVAYFIFSGPVDSTTGMLINISEIKEQAAGPMLVFSRSMTGKAGDEADFLWLSSGVRRGRHLFVDAAPLFSDVEAKLCACHLTESPERSATYYASGVSEANYWFEFSAARKTLSPRLSADENAQLFGPATSTHGHNYRARLTFRSERLDEKGPLVRYDAIDACLRALRNELDYRYLNEEVAGLKDRPITTESLARYIYERVKTMLPAHRVRLHERDDFFAEAWGDKIVLLGLQMPFHAAHRLHAAALSDTENSKLYGKCNNLSGHGHGYLTEATVGGEYDKRSGTLYDFVALKSAIEESLEPWRDRHLDLETEDFRDTPSTGENIVLALWPKLDNRLEQRLLRLRLWETQNNRFTLRRT